MITENEILLLIWITGVLAVLVLGATAHEIYVWLKLRREEKKKWN